MTIIWKDVSNYIGLYQVSNTGLVKSNQRAVFYGIHKRTTPERILKPSKTHGYLQVVLYNKGKTKTYKVHTLVCNAFVDKPNILDSTVDHKDGNKLNNNSENLQWISRQLNTKQANEKPYKVQSPAGDVCFITNLSSFCKLHGLSNPNLFKVVVGKRKHHKGWKAWAM